jgi:hypothetical protein
MPEPGTPDGALLCNFAAKRFKTESALFRGALETFNYEISQEMLPQVGRSRGQAESDVKKKEGRISPPLNQNDPR